MSYNVDEKMSGIVNVLYTNYNDLIDIKQKEHIIIEPIESSVENQEILDTIIDDLIEIKNKQSLDLVIKRRKKLEIKIVSDLDEYNKDEWVLLK